MFEHISRKSRGEIQKTSEKKVNLGSGQYKLPGDWMRVDYDELYKPDFIQDVTDVPWKLPDDEFGVIWCSHLIEHIPDHRPFLHEVHRVAKHDALFVLMFPHYSRSWFSAQHLRAYGIHILRGHDHMFEVERVRLKYTWWGWKHWYKIPAYCMLWTLEFLANLSPAIWERVWCYWFGGFDQVIIEARVKKNIKTVDVAKVNKLEG
jgi:SAM-dependent methyltransferase